jgi:hypothetical protein
MHSPQSVALADGRVLTVVMHPVNYTWRGAAGPGEARGTPIGSLMTEPLVVSCMEAVWWC